MSASNWALCPKCTRGSEEAFRYRARQIEESYGVWPVAKFDEARTNLAADMKAFENRTPTFREDYEIYGAEDGEVTVSYSGGCTECGLSLDFKDVRPIPGLDTYGKNGADT